MITKKIYRKRSHDSHLVKRGLKSCRMIHQSRVVMHKTDSWKDRVSFYRFRRNEQVTRKGLTDNNEGLNTRTVPLMNDCRIEYFTKLLREDWEKI